MKLQNKIREAIQRSGMRDRMVYIHPLNPEIWGCKDEAYCIHILTFKRQKPDAESLWDCYESEEDKSLAKSLAESIEALGKISDRELFGDANFYRRQVYVGDVV
jgi:hypothetical protein